MKEIPVNYIEEGQELYFNVERLMQVESALKMPVGKIVKEQDLGVNIMVTLLSIVKALAGSGILGRETYLMFWPEEATEAELCAMKEEREKN